MVKQKFSERMGLVDLKAKLQLNTINPKLQNRLWNDYLMILDSINIEQRNDIFILIWTEEMVYPIDEMPKTKPGWVDLRKSQFEIKEWFESLEWNEVYQFFESVIEWIPQELCSDMAAFINISLEKESSGYRFIEKMFVPLTTDQELASIKDALNEGRNNPVSVHQKLALEKISNREKPDLRNSVKESISAVEALCREITGDKKAELSKALAILEKTHALHPALKKSFTTLYAYTSDSGGIRHALDKDGVEVTFDDAKFMLVSCSAFINYLRSKMLEHG